LELGRVLMLAGDYQGARYNFEQVLAHKLPETVQRNVLHMLQRIREELPSFDATLEVVYDSNPRQATSSKEVEIGGLTYRLDENARARSAMGLRFFLDGRVPLANAPMWFLCGQAEHLEYPEDDLDFSYLQVAGRRHLPLEDHTLTLEAGYHWSIYQHKQLYRGAVWSVSDFRPLRPDIFLRLTLSGLQLKYPTFEYHTGWQHTAGAALIYAASPTTRWDMGLGYTIKRASESIYSFDQPYVSLRYVHEWQGGWITGASIKASRIKYNAADPFFGVTRREREIRVEMDVLNRRIRFWRLTPRLIVGYADRSANLDFFTWHRAFVQMGMTADF